MSLLRIFINRKVMLVTTVVDGGLFALTYLFEGILTNLLFYHIKDDGGLSHGSFAPEFSRMKVGNTI